MTNIFELSNMFDILDQPVQKEKKEIKVKRKKINLDFSIFINGIPILVKYDSDLIVNRINQVIDHFRQHDRDRVNCDFTFSSVRNRLELGLKTYKQTDTIAESRNRQKTDYPEKIQGNQENMKFCQRKESLYSHNDFLNCDLNDFETITLNNKKILFNFALKIDPNYIPEVKPQKNNRAIAVNSVNVFSNSFFYCGKKYQLKINEKNEVFLREVNTLKMYLIGYCQKEKIINYQWFDTIDSLPISDFLNNQKLTVYQVFNLENLALSLLDKNKTGGNYSLCLSNEYNNNKLLWLIDCYLKIFNDDQLIIDNMIARTSFDRIVAIKREVTDSYTVNFKPSQLCLKDFPAIINKVNKAISNLTLKITDQVKIDQYKDNKLKKSLLKCFITYCNKPGDIDQLWFFVNQEIVNKKELKDMIITFKHNPNNGLSRLFDQWLSYN